MTGGRRFRVGKLLGAGVAVSVAAGAWAGISGASTQHVTSKAASVTTIQFWSWDPGMAGVVSQFNRTHPTIKVVLSAITPEYPKLSASIKAGSPPDVAQIEYEALPQYIASGALYNLQSAGFSKYKSDFAAWAWSQVNVDGGIWALPQDAGPTVMYYRKDLFKKYKIPVPTSWAQFATDAVTLHKDDPSAYITDFAANDPSWLLGLMAQNGASWFGTTKSAWTVSVNGSASVKVANYWQRLLNEKVVKTDPDFTVQFWHDLTKGNVATWITGGWAAELLLSEVPSTSGDWGVAQMPSWNASAPTSANIGGSSDVIFKASAHKAADETFVSWMNATSKSWASLYSDVHLVPTYTSAYKLPAVNHPIKFFGGQNLAPVLETASSRVNEKFVWSPVTESLYTEAADLFGQVVEGKGTLSGALSNLQTYAVKVMQSGGFPVKSS